MKVGIFYFSGCGNTAWVTQKTIERLTDSGHEVVFLYNLEKDFPAEFPKTDLDMFFSPIYYAGIPSLVVDKIKRLPITGDKKASFWTVAGQFSGIGRTFGAFLLKDRGYEVHTTHMIRMPDTYLPLKISQITEEQKKEIYQKAIEEIKEGVSALEKEEPCRVESKITAFIASLLYFPYLYYLRYVLSYCFISTNACIKCGKCERDCPCQVIHRKNGRPQWYKGCTGCFRCVNTCPVSAIDISWIGFSAGIFLGLIGLFFFIIYCGFLGSILGFLIKIIAFLFGFWLGTLSFQKIYQKLPVEKGLLMKGRKRVFLSDEEK